MLFLITRGRCPASKRASSNRILLSCSLGLWLTHSLTQSHSLTLITTLLLSHSITLLLSSSLPLLLSYSFFLTIFTLVLVSLLSLLSLYSLYSFFFTLFS